MRVKKSVGKAFPLFLADFDGATLGWTEAERMAYLRVLVFIWDEGGAVPASRTLIGRVGRIPASRAYHRVVDKIVEKLDTDQLPVAWAHDWLANHSGLVGELRKVWFPNQSTNQSDLVREPTAEWFPIHRHHTIDRIMRHRAETHDKLSKAGKAGGHAKAKAARNHTVLPSVSSKKEGSIETTSDRPSVDGKTPSASTSSPAYAFEGRVVRLNAADFAKWTAQFPSLNLDRELTGIDAWFLEQPASARKRWFWATHQMLQKRARALEPAADTPDRKLRVVATPTGEHLVDDRDGSTYVRSPSGALIPLSGGGV
jgi:hypothetical protein